MTTVGYTRLAARICAGSVTITKSMKQPLSVRAKIILIVIIGVAGLLLLQYLISSQVLLKSYLSLERVAMEQDIRRATDAIAEFSDQQQIKLADWASWDQAYDFGYSRDEAWTKENVSATGMANLDINVIAVADTNGGVFYLQAVDIEQRVEVDGAGVAGYFAAHPDLVRHSVDSSTKGLVLLPEGPMILVSLPLLTTEGTGPTPGSISFGRYLDDAKIADFADITHLAITMYPFSGSELPAEVAQAKADLVNGAESVVTPASEHVLSGYALLRDVRGEPILIVRVETPRPIYAQGTLTLLTFLVTSALAITVFGIVILFFLDQFVISRFLRLTADVEKVNVERNLSVQLQGGVKDEVGRLSDKINQLLGWLREARESDATSRREMLNLLDELKKGKEQATEMASLLKKK